MSYLRPERTFYDRVKVFEGENVWQLMQVHGLKFTSRGDKKGVPLRLSPLFPARTLSKRDNILSESRNGPKFPT